MHECSYTIGTVANGRGSVFYENICCVWNRSSALLRCAGRGARPRTHTAVRSWLECGRIILIILLSYHYLSWYVEVVYCSYKHCFRVRAVARPYDYFPADLGGGGGPARGVNSIQNCERRSSRAAGYRMAPLHFTVHLCSLHVLFNVPCVRVALCLWADGPRRVSRRVYHLRCDAVQANERASG